MRVNVVAIALIIAASAIPAAAQSSGRAGGFEIRTLSTRGDLVTGDDVLVQIATPATAGTNVAILVNGRDPTAELRPTTQPNVLLVRLKGLQPGKNLVEVGLKGQKPVAQIAIVNHSIAGPVISGPHQTPFFCETVPVGLGQPLDADCAATTRVEYFYRSNAPVAAPAAAGRGAGRGGQNAGRGGDAGAAAPREVDNPNAPPPNAFKPYDPAAPRPADLMMTTTTEGRTVPYIVRREMGTINRAAYVIAFLHEPGTPLPDPWTTNTTWNQRLIYSYGGGCAAGYHQGRGFGGLSAGASDLEEAQVGLGDYPISKGFAIAAATLNVTGTSCADLISAETTMMVKEHFIETYGMPRYTIGAGGSGGSMQQHQIAANYPGLLDGIIPNRSFPDIISTVDVLTDCELMDRYFKETKAAWTPEQKTEVSGFKDFSYCANGARYPNLHAANCNQVVAKDSVYDAAANKNGARCTYQDNMVNVYGRDPKTGFARRPFDNTGVQYGLAALNAGQITVDQFIDLNAHIGGLNIDGNPSAERMVGDTEALRIAYRTGRINNGAALAGIPIIDFRSYLDGTGDVHHAVPTLQMRARLLATNGTAANQVIVTTASQGSLARDLAAQDAVFRTEQRAMFDAMDQWLAAITADKAPAKSAGEKVVRDKPRDLVDACYTADKQKVTDAAKCAQLFPYASNARMVAGEPMTGDVLKCALKPIDRKNYKQPVTDSQLASLRTLFPQGVCDYSKKGVGQAAPQGTWLSYPVPRNKHGFTVRRSNMTRSTTAALIVVGLSLTGTLAAQQKPAAPALEIRSLSTRPELVSGGDVLVQVTGAANLTAKNLTVRLNGKDVSASFKPAPEGKVLVGLLTGLQVGSNSVQASMRGSKATAQLTLVNHPITGPVLYSPHQMPFICETQANGLGAPLDADCSATTKVEYFYRSSAVPTGAGQNPDDLAAADGANGFGRGGAAASPFKPLDPNGPRPTDIAMTTTTEGKTVPYIVRREMGTINRAVYSIAFLHEPGTPLPSPWTTGGSWNGRLVYTFGGGVAWGYHQGRTIGGLNGARGNMEDGQYGDYPVAKGYALAGSSLNVFGTYANDVVSAETLMMVKEHFIEEFGAPRYTIGSGRSGGSMQQHMIANNYPGLLDAIDPTASFADTFTFQTEMLDCEVIDRAMTVSKQPFTTDQKTAVSGYSHFDYCTNNKLRYAAVVADLNCDAAMIPQSLRFDPATNPKGARCTYQDANIAVYGADPKTGFARRPFDNTGVQYGLGAFNAGKINFAQFLDINRLAGGHDVNGNLVTQRDVADPDALRIAYESGRFNDAAHGLSMIPIIDMRPYVEGAGGNVHDTFDGTITRARLVAANGNADNQISRVYEPGAPVTKAQDDNLEILDKWLAAMAKDTAPGTQREKVIRNKPAGLADSCFTAKLDEIKDAARCKAMFPVFANVRVVAGAPTSDDRLKCELKAIDKADYKRPVTDAQLANLRTVFPQGVCDYSKKGVSQVPAQTWLSYPSAAPATTR